MSKSKIYILAIISSLIVCILGGLIISFLWGFDIVIYLISTGMIILLVMPNVGLVYAPLKIFLFKDHYNFFHYIISAILMTISITILGTYIIYYTRSPGEEVNYALTALTFFLPCLPFSIVGALLHRYMVVSLLKKEVIN